MNIFVLDANPITAARFHNDRHCVKMILESCQLMATAHFVYDKKVPRGVEIRPSHINHPCAKWVRSEHANYDWLHALCGALLIEFHQRYGHPHSFVEKWERLWGAPLLGCSHELRTEPLCMPDECRVYVPGRAPGTSYCDTVLSYRNYYIREKQHLAQWYRGDTSKVPSWFKMKEAA